MTNDLISREKVERVIMAMVHEPGLIDDASVFGYMVLNAVRTMQAIDAEPVVHGRWISHFDRSECSACGGICWADSASTYDYCPNCGAKMDLEE